MIGERSTASGQAALIFFNYAYKEAQTIEQALGTANARLNTPPDSSGNATEEGRSGYSSDHAGGVIQFLFCDGSVQQIQIQLSIMPLRNGDIEPLLPRELKKHLKSFAAERTVLFSSDPVVVQFCDGFVQQIHFRFN